MNRAIGVLISLVVVSPVALAQKPLVHPADAVESPFLGLQPFLEETQGLVVAVLLQDGAQAAAGQSSPGGGLGRGSGRCR